MCQISRSKKGGGCMVNSFRRHSSTLKMVPFNMIETDFYSKNCLKLFIVMCPIYNVKVSMITIF